MERDRYVGSDGMTHRRLRAGREDESADHRGPYHGACSGCYLGLAHSEAYHEAHAHGAW